jgi:hypothetical protein
MVQTRRGTTTSRYEDLHALQRHYDSRNKACGCGGRNGDCNCAEEGHSNSTLSHYKEKDTCHRHRKADGESKTETVTTYKRRKPVK